MCVEVFQADAEQAKKEHDNRGIHNKQGLLFHWKYLLLSRGQFD